MQLSGCTWTSEEPNLRNWTGIASGSRNSRPTTAFSPHEGLGSCSRPVHCGMQHNIPTRGTVFATSCRDIERRVHTVDEPITADRFCPKLPAACNLAYHQH